MTKQSRKYMDMSVHILLAVYCKCPLGSNFQCAYEKKLHNREANWPLRETCMTTCSSGVLLTVGTPNTSYNVDAYNNLFT